MDIATWGVAIHRVVFVLRNSREPVVKLDIIRSLESLIRRTQARISDFDSGKYLSTDLSVVCCWFFNIFWDQLCFNSINNLVATSC